MPLEQRLGRSNIHPLGEALPPPLIVLMDFVKLRKVKCENAHQISPLRLAFSSRETCAL